jgi:hypothetical protein
MTEITDEQIALILRAKEIAEKNTPASATPTAPTLHGPFHGDTTQFGIFSTPGVRPERWSTLARPWSFASILSIEKSRFWTEKLEVMTGVTAAAGSNAANFCGDPPTVGQGKICKQNYNWGKYYVKTDLNVLAYIGSFKDRADVPADILNAGPTNNPFIPDIMFRMLPSDSQLRYEFWRIGVEFERGLDVSLIQGNNATAIGTHGWFADFNGLDLQIKTGYTDADTQIACPAMDSVVISHSANVNAAAADGRNIVQEMGDLMYGLKQRASKFMMPDTQWVIVMREELFRSFVEQYACSYALYKCAGTQYEENNTMQSETNRLRLEMITGRYILVDGTPVPVVFSEGIPQTTPAANTFQSDMYIVPVAWRGMPLLRVEHFPMDNQPLTEFSNFQGEGTAVLNNGLWLVGNRNTGLCKEYHFQLMMRLILETPFLAGRIDDLQYTFAAPIRNALPGASYYADGGISYRS